MNEEKKVPFKWEYGEETISLQLGMYANNQRLYIGMITHTEDGEEPFADMTVNLPGYSLDPGEAFISGDISKDLLRFITISVRTPEKPDICPACQRSKAMVSRRRLAA